VSRQFAVRRGGGFQFGHGFPMSPWVKRLLIANLAVWGLFALGILPRGAIEWLGFAVPTSFLRPWTAVTYMFVHVGFGHLFTNMLVLFFFGPPLENHWGSRFFLKFYLACGLGGAAFHLLLGSLIGPVPMIGASGAIFGLLLAFAMNWPDAKIYLYFLFPVPAKWFVGILGAFTLFATVQGGGGGVAHWAHLGGLVTGFLYLRFGERIGRGLKRGFFKEKPSHVRVERGGRAEAPRRERREPRPSSRRAGGVDGDALDEVDRILDKIRESGMDSLTPKERAFLDEMSRRYQKTTRTH